jgi:hypothetical protein
MLQLFLQTSAITAADWDKVYPQIVELAEAFPLQLIRIEAYDGFERDKQDKDHFDLVVNRGQIDEHLCFYGDWVSWTTGTSVRFYKNWSKHCELTLEEQKSDSTRPITWFPPTRFKDDGSICLSMRDTTQQGEHLGFVAQIRAESNAANKTLILRQLKEKRGVTTAGPDFERWLEAEEDADVLLFLRLLLSLKIYTRPRAYARYRILHDRTRWGVWKKWTRF